MPTRESVGVRAYAKELLTIVIAMLSLTACATPASLAPGTPEAEVIRRFGRPAEVYTLPAPPQARRLAYPIGLHYQQTWMVDIDAQGRVLHVEEAINAAHFAKVRIGQDDTSVIRREFGPPRVIHFYALSGLTAWMYPYLEDLAWNSEMAIYFDRAGIVRRVESGPDPRFLGGSDNRND